ncbi:hypothetical protein [Helicobacter sp. T3_23-1059]
MQGKNTNNATSLHNAKILDTISSQKLDKGSNMDNQKLAQAFGNNYEEFRGQGIKAFNHLSQVRNGFVAGAFYREDIGSIDLV